MRRALLKRAGHSAPPGIDGIRCAAEDGTVRSTGVCRGFSRRGRGALAFRQCNSLSRGRCYTSSCRWSGGACSTSSLTQASSCGICPYSSSKNKLIIVEGKPYQAMAMHIHFHHSGGLHQFTDVTIHSSEAEALRIGDGFETCCFMSRRECSRPSGPWSPHDNKLKPTTSAAPGEGGAPAPETFAGEHLPPRQTKRRFLQRRHHLPGSDAQLPPLFEQCPDLESIDTILSLADGVRRDAFAAQN